MFIHPFVRHSVSLLVNLFVRVFVRACVRSFVRSFVRSVGRSIAGAIHTCLSDFLWPTLITVIPNSLQIEYSLLSVAVSKALVASSSTEEKKFSFVKNKLYVSLTILD